MADFRIDDLARAAGTTVRHVRGFQERGLLPPPRMKGRVGYYDDTHLARIHLITRLKDRGYTLASIGEMLSAWERGHNLADLLGLERVIHDPWSDEEPARMTLAQVVRRFYPQVPEEALEGRTPADFPRLRRAEQLEFIRWTGEGYEVPSPRLLEVGAGLVEAGIELDAVFEIADRLRGDVDAIARQFVRLTVEHAGLDARLADRDIREVGEVIQRLRPIGMQAVQGLLARSLHAEIQAEFIRQIETIGPPPPKPGSAARPAEPPAHAGATPPPVAAQPPAQVTADATSLPSADGRPR
ncbi:MerR family transcriptional regulator [Actinomadura verrucosospora]|uniref:MerR family transcriptional regulator n=1 Tax=Actinomadura verrucosospora TaxID=46165 RepID=A0A7D4A769_ACTVE|nr:MerR family transcriptional regulator [Actinomadura verrucosospora]QKG26824.1 MerR family transcriptional regulator [Actinomadura verrucosospora]